VKFEYKPPNPDASKPLNRNKVSHVIREDAEKIAENLYKSDAGKIIGTLKLLSMPQIHQITDITFQVAEVQHKFDTVEGFVTNIKIIDAPATVGSTATTTTTAGAAGPAAGAGITSTEVEFAGVAAAEAVEATVEEEPTWIEIELIDAFGKPIKDEKFIITSPDGEEYTGKTDEKGLAKIDGIVDGWCKVSFPNMDKDIWEKWLENIVPQE
jgi:hypothetical protein